MYKYAQSPPLYRSLLIISFLVLHFKDLTVDVIDNLKAYLARNN